MGSAFKKEPLVAGAVDEARAAEPPKLAERSRQPDPEKTVNFRESPIPVTAEPGCAEHVQKALDCPKFKMWYQRAEKDKHFEVETIHFQSIDMFGPKVGFLKFKLTVKAGGKGLEDKGKLNEVCQDLWVTMKPESVDASDTKELVLKQVPNNRTYKGLEYENQGIWKKPFFFVQMADTQFGMLGGGRRGLEEEEAMCNVAVDHINRLKPAFAIVCGDMTNSYPENSSTPLYLQHAEKDAFKRVFSRVDESIPLLCVCGNHDIGDRPNSKTLNIYKKRWGDDYYSFWFGGVKFLVINTQVYKALEKEPYAEDLLRMRKAQDEWLEKELKATEEENPAHLVILSHIPPYIEAPDEEDGYFNLKSTTRQELVTKCKAKGASKWLCGHYHRNSCACDADGKFEVVVTGAVGCNFKTRPGSNRKARLGLAGEGQMFFTPEMSGFRIVKIRQDSIDHQFYCLSDMPANVDASAPRWEESSDSVSNKVLRKWRM